MTKKEFKKNCKKEKALSYKLTLSGGIIASIGLIVVIAALLLIKSEFVQIIMYGFGFFIAVVGGGLDLAGEIMLANNYKAYNNKNQKA